MDNSTHGMSEKLVQYLDGELSGAEKAAVEQLLATDPSAQAGYESLLQARAAIKHYALKQKVSTLHSDMMEELLPNVRRITPAKKIFRYSMAVAASLVLLIGAYLAYNFLTLSSDKVFSANYRTYELGNVRDGNEPQSTPVEKAFSEKNYQEVLRIHDAGEDHTPKGEFLCGIAALELREDAKAIKCFNEVLDANRQNGQLGLNDEAEYYLSLSYIRNKDYDFALPLLNKIKSDTEHKYNKEISSGLIRKVKLLKWR